VAGLLVENGFVLTMDEQDRVHNPGWVWIEGDRIGAVGPGRPPDALIPRAERVIDATGMAVLPGLVNGHTHLSQTFMRGLADDRSLIAWLKQVVWPVQNAMTPEEMRLASLLGLVENLRCGVTAVVQHHKVTTSPGHVDAAAEAAQVVRLRLLLARGWADMGVGAEPPETIIDDMIRLREHWHGAGEGRITIGFGPLVPWRCSEAMMRKTVALAQEWGVPTHIHVAETHSEVEMLRRQTGLGNVEWLHSLGALGPDVQLVHCVWVEDAELDLIAESRSLVVHCPVSNMYLASGVAPVGKMLDRGITVALGTDGPASNNSQDLLETLKVAVLLAKVSTGEAQALSPMKALRMATVSGRKQFPSSEPSGLQAGAKADLTLVNLETVRSAPVHSPASALVYNASGPDVHTVIVDGRILLDAGQVTTVDEAALLAECKRVVRSLLKRAGVAGSILAG
jgi:5-methylthioadenosine/S-adenosylhomocysteine deaminase